MQVAVAATHKAVPFLFSVNVVCLTHIVTRQWDLMGYKLNWKFQFVPNRLESICTAESRFICRWNEIHPVVNWTLGMWLVT